MIFLMLFIEFFKVGLFTFGGGFAMIPLIEDIVVSYGWLTEAEFYNLIGICESTPGPVAINMATYIGSEQGGLFGSFCATLGVVLPSFIIIVLIAAILKNFTENRFFRGFIRGVKPVVAALILATGTTLLLKNIGISLSGTFKPGWAAIIVLAVVSALYFFFEIVFKKKLSAIQIILISAVLGVLVCNIISP